MNLQWPEQMPASGRVTKEQSDDAWATGICRVTDPTMSCPQTLHITLFFDGTNNNDAEDNFWRDSKKQTHTNVARLYKASLLKPDEGIFRYYIPGVGTPFPQIGEPLYTTKGKAMAAGFGARCAWGYTRLLNAVYYAISPDKTQVLMLDRDAKGLCIAGENGHMSGFKPYIDRLGIAMKNAVDDSAWPRTVKQIWINVIGFSRGAAAARAFVYKLVNEWAPNGKLGDQTGRYALPYTVNFMGLFDTVASVGIPDSARPVANLVGIAGHDGLAGHGAMAIPAQVKASVHAFSIHEQRMSFPLDSIRKGGSYPGGIRHEIAYPGVHSDVGGGYGPGEQGKACDNKGQGDDSRKLSQIPLHDMYIAALRYGVPLMRAEAIQKSSDLAVDFLLDTSTIDAFNAWRETREPISRIEDAVRFGMGQMLSWRTLRAQIGTTDYVTGQPFFQRATEDAKIPRQVSLAVDNAQETDPKMRELRAQLERVRRQQSEDSRSTSATYNPSAWSAAQSRIASINDSMRARGEQLCGEVAHPDAKPGPLPNSARPGENGLDIGTNDKTDLLQGAEEMRLLLGYLYPEQQRDVWKVQTAKEPDQFTSYKYPPDAPSNAPPRMTLSVQHEGIRDDPPGTASPKVTLVHGVLMHSINTSGLQNYKISDDVVAKPIEAATPFLRQHASLEAARKLPGAAVKLFDDYVHDSRCWFRVPYFHEYASGGYFWPRIVFIGGDDRASVLGFNPLLLSINTETTQDTALA